MSLIRDLWKTARRHSWSVPNVRNVNFISFISQDAAIFTRQRNLVDCKHTQVFLNKVSLKSSFFLWLLICEEETSFVLGATAASLQQGGHEMNNINNNEKKGVGGKHQESKVLIVWTECLVWVTDALSAWFALGRCTRKTPEKTVIEEIIIIKIMINGKKAKITF